MKVWFKKLKNNLASKGLRGTSRVVFNYFKNQLYGGEKIKMKLLKKYAARHNQAYAKISQLAVSLNKGEHPKHRIMRYNQFFIDHIETKDRVLDAGSGNGLVAFLVAEKAAYVLGVDNNRQSVEEAKKKYERPNLHFMTADLNEYETEEKFDKIILSNVLEHIDERVILLKKLRSFSPIILLRVPLVTRDWLTVYKKEMGFEYKLDPTHSIEYSEEELARELKAAGWQVKEKRINWGEWWGVLERIIL